MIGTLLILGFCYALLGALVWMFASDVMDDDQALGFATIWPLSVAYTLLRWLVIGIRYWAATMMRLARRAIPARQKIAPRVAPDPILEAARREVEAIAPEEP